MQWKSHHGTRHRWKKKSHYFSWPWTQYLRHRSVQFPHHTQTSSNSPTIEAGSSNGYVRTSMFDRTYCIFRRNKYYITYHYNFNLTFSNFIFLNLLAPELFFLILAHSVYKMWIIQEPNKLELWNKLHFKEKKTESIHHV